MNVVKCPVCGSDIVVKCPVCGRAMQHHRLDNGVVHWYECADVNCLRGPVRPTAQEAAEAVQRLRAVPMPNETDIVKEAYPEESHEPS